MSSPSNKGVTPGYWLPQANPWLIAIAVMLATILEVLDTSVANVALPHMAGNLSAGTDEATWVLTSYLISNAIVLPMTGWFSSYFGRKRFLLSCIVLFTIASAACGAAPTLALLIMARIIQGAAGGALQPLSHAILMESFPPEKRGVAMAIFGMGVVVAPIIGPTLGGWITDNYSWRWIFYLNLPIGALSLFMCNSFIEDPPYIQTGKNKKIDYIGFIFMALWLATLQIILDKGQQDDWFSANWICWFAAISAVSMIAFIIWELMSEHPLVNLRVLKNRNFAVGTSMMTIVGVVLYSTITLLPLYLQNLMGYSALDSGLALSPRGLGAVVAMVVIGRIIGKVDTRALIALGYTGLAFSAYMLSDINLQITMSHIIWPNILMGLSMSLIFVPLTTISMGDLPNEQMGNAAGIFNLMRNLGGSIGISVVTTMLARGAQAHQAYLAKNTSVYNQAFQQSYNALTSGLSQATDALTAQTQALGTLYNTLVQQANMLAYIDNFRLLAFLAMLCIPCIVLFKKLRLGKVEVSAH